MDRVLALMQPALMSLAQKGAEGNPVGGETTELEVDSAPDQGGRPKRAGVPPKSAFPPVPKRARKVAPKLGGGKSAPKRTLAEGTRDPNMGQADTQPEVAITGAVAGTTLEGAVSVSEREPGGDLVSGLAKVLPWLAKLGNAPQIDLASEGSALATLKGLAMGIGANLQGATTGTQEPPRATATTSHEPTSSIALPAVVGTTTSTSPPAKQGEGATQTGGTHDQVLSPRDQLGPHISSELRAKIHKGTFVDIFELTVVKPADEESKDIKDCSHKWKKPKVDETIINWIKGFTIYQSILLEKFPELGPQTAYYLNKIVGVHEEFGGTSWKDYDKAFRLKKASNPSMCWDQTDVNAWLHCMMLRKPEANVQSLFRGPTASGDRKGACWAFNKRACSRPQGSCKFKHNCSFCGTAGHHEFKCFKKSKEKVGQK
ncbi:hypothetical protein NDU88_001440 [Pleurodeles waltl]|uniref:C3H1-type domain-containing protein n=1 Tax=Pleurodeles waltl TaxID=8319 RepID=A0AAV7V7T4_PLEWA|nr:hypothetical protein NDU88_001440 [Pleurodeles waltl]